MFVGLQATSHTICKKCNVHIESLAYSESHWQKVILVVSVDLVGCREQGREDSNYMVVDKAAKIRWYTTVLNSK